MLRKRIFVMVGTVALLVGLTAVANAATGPAPAAAPAAPAAQGASSMAMERTTTVRYGPHTIPATVDGEHGHENVFDFNIEKPCTNCYLTGFKPNLVYADGSNANVNTGPMLHHTVIFDTTNDDIVCPGSRRVFASGNERVASQLPAGYGYRIGYGDRWAITTELMNHEYVDKTVYLEIEFTYERAWFSDLDEVQPLWLDVGGCLSSAWDIPPGGPREDSNTWTSTVSGDIVHQRGHLHRGGEWLRTDNVTKGETLCTSRAEYGGSPEFTDIHGNQEISNMTHCEGPLLGTLDVGDQLRITSGYRASENGWNGVMGIGVAWLAPR